MIKKLIVFASILFSIVSWSQENTASPYSYYGLGEIKFKGTEDARSMGGIGIVADSIHFNLLNPASYSKIKFSTFAIGSTSTFSTFETNGNSEKAKRTNLNYLAVGLPIKKFGVSFGLMPYSAVGYKIESNSHNDVDNTDRMKISTGNGNINRLFIGSSYAINKKLSFGFNINYNFGVVETEFIETIYAPVELQLRTREKNNSNINGFSFNTGVYYSRNLSQKLKLNSSFVYSPEATLVSENSRNIATIFYNIYGGEIISLPTQDIPVEDQKMKIPAKYTFGSGIGMDKKWFLGAEISFQENSKLRNRFKDINNATFENSTRISLGGYFVPKHDSFSNYFSRVIYRAGFRYENTGLVIRNESINDYGMTFGIGLPVGLSKINLGFEFGKKGTTSQGLVQENYFNLNIGLSLNDLWFRKREIN
jgi:hypothetical protein